MNSKSKLYTMAMMGAMLSSFARTSEREYYENEQKPNKEPIVPKGHIHYWFRIDGTFLNEKQSERMLKEDCVFKCFALNDKNAIKKFRKWSNENNL